ncbi:hypothetical protein FQN60_011241, partial [Etheostoma spectabile]
MSKIVKCLSEGCCTLKVAKILWRDHQTINHFVANSQHGCKKLEKKRRRLTARDLRRIKREVTRNPFTSSAAIFQNCNLPGVFRRTRCSVLRDTAQLKRQDWAKKYLKPDFSKVLWTDEMRVALDGPDGWARGWLSNGHRAPLRVGCRQGGGGVL